LDEPPRTGLNWLAYVVPPIVILIGAFFVFRAIQTMRKQTPATAAPAQGPVGEAPVDDYVARLEDEIKKRN
jgi:cytochrome c-type biogenesis protein CcmH/NrfF